MYVYGVCTYIRIYIYICIIYVCMGVCMVYSMNVHTYCNYACVYMVV